MSLTLRNTKGSKLTFTEMDGNFSYLEQLTQQNLTTSSFNAFTGSASITGSFTGSFIGDGSGLTGITTDSVAFDNITGKPTLVSSSIQIDHDQTTNYNANEHFTQANITTVGTVTTGDVSAILPTSDLVRNTTDTYTGTDKITQIITLSQAEYDAISTKSDATLYIIL